MELRAVEVSALKFILTLFSACCGLSRLFQPIYAIAFLMNGVGGRGLGGSEVEEEKGETCTQENIYFHSSLVLLYFRYTNALSPARHQAERLCWLQP